MTNPVRVLHVIGVMNRGGAEAMIMNLYRNIDRAKVQFDFVQNEGEEAAFDEEIRSLGGRIYRCPRYRGQNHFAYVNWWQAFFKSHGGEYPIVHGHIGSTAAIYLSIAGKYGCYTIAHSHNINMMKSVGDIVYGAFAYPTRYIADHFFACSREAGISRYGKKIGNDNTKCMVVPNAVDTDRFAFDENKRYQMRQMLGIANEQPVIGNISRFAPQKNHRFLIDIFERIHERNPSAVLLLVGDGELRPKIEDLIAAKNLQDNVILAGIRVNTWDYYQAMDVFLMPSLYEGLPVSLVEAQTAGLPCCVSAVVPHESAITSLVRFRSLSDDAAVWANWVLASTVEKRVDMRCHMHQAGYDISATSKWLEEFYTKVVTGRD